MKSIAGLGAAGAGLALKADSNQAASHSDSGDAIWVHQKTHNVGRRYPNGSDNVPYSMWGHSYDLREFQFSHNRTLTYNKTEAVVPDDDTPYWQHKFTIASHGQWLEIVGDYDYDSQSWDKIYDDYVCIPPTVSADHRIVIEPRAKKAHSGFLDKYSDVKHISPESPPHIWFPQADVLHSGHTLGSDGATSELYSTDTLKDRNEYTDLNRVAAASMLLGIPALASGTLGGASVSAMIILSRVKFALSAAAVIDSLLDTQIDETHVDWGFEQGKEKPLDATFNTTGQYTGTAHLMEFKIRQYPGEALTVPVTDISQFHWPDGYFAQYGLPENPFPDTNQSTIYIDIPDNSNPEDLGEPATFPTTNTDNSNETLTWVDAPDYPNHSDLDPEPNVNGVFMDMDGDGDVDQADVDVFDKYNYEPELRDYPSLYDYEGNGYVGMGDREEIEEFIATETPTEPPSYQNDDDDCVAPCGY